MFKTKFEVIEIFEDVIITNYLRGSRKEVKKDIETFKSQAKHVEIGPKKMFVWR